MGILPSQFIKPEDTQMHATKLTVQLSKEKMRQNQLQPKLDFAKFAQLETKLRSCSYLVKEKKEEPHLYAKRYEERTKTCT